MRRQLVFLGLVVAIGMFSYRVGKSMEFRGFSLFAVPSRVSAPATIAPAAIPARAQAYDEDWEDMIGRLRAAATHFPGRMGIYLKDLSTGRVWEFHSDELFPSASLIKVPVMTGVFEKIRSREIRLDDELVLRPGEKVGGSGTLRRRRYGTRLTVYQLMHKMITESDNTATKMLVDHMGFDFLQSHFAAIGLVNTKIYPEGLSLTSDKVERENYTTPKEMAMLMESIYRGEMIDRESSAMMLDILKQTKTRSRFAKWLPRSWELAHKTGLLRLSCHDVGIFFAPRGPYLMAVLTWKVPDYHYAANYIGKMAKITYGYYGTPQPLLAQAGNADRF